MLLDACLPEYQFAERHEVVVKASVEEVYAAVCALDMSTSPLVHLLFRLRGLPPATLTLDGLRRSRFTLLGQHPDQELVLGIVGRFWRLSGDLQRLDAEGFKSFDRRGYAKAAWNFSLTPMADAVTCLATETRILCLDEHSRRRFRLYWLLIGPFSACIRREILRIIKSKAEEDRRRRPPEASEIFE